MLSLLEMKLKIEFNEEKNILLKETRGVCFDDAVEAIKKNQVLDDLEHYRQKKYPGQKILVVRIKNYVYAIPYVVDKRKGVIFLKTVYPSRDLTNKYLRKDKS